MAKNIFSTNYTLGILGGGQLGKMMLYTTRKFDIKTKVLDPSPDAPGQFGANEFQVGSLQDYDTVMAFAADCDTVCIEIEAVNVQALRDLRAQGKKVHPNPDSLELIQDKTKQKQFYADHNIPTSRFEMVAEEPVLKLPKSAGHCPSFGRLQQEDTMALVSSYVERKPIKHLSQMPRACSKLLWTLNLK